MSFEIWVKNFTDRQEAELKVLHAPAEETHLRFRELFDTQADAIRAAKKADAIRGAKRIARISDHLEAEIIRTPVKQNPPAIGFYLVDLLLSPEDAESALANLDEIFQRRVGSKPIYARLWFCAQAIRIVTTSLIQIMRPSREKA